MRSSGTLDKTYGKAILDDAHAKRQLETLVQWRYMCSHFGDVTEGDCATFARLLRATDEPDESIAIERRAANVGRIEEL